MILCIGTTPAVQRVMVFPKLAVDHVNRARLTLEGAAGKSINVAKVLKALGEKPVATGFLGGDRGDFLRGVLKAKGIETDFINVTARTRQCLTVIDEAAGTQTELVEESAAVTRNDYQKLMAIVQRWLGSLTPRGPDAVLMSGTLTPGGPPTFYFHCTKLARAAGALAGVQLHWVTGNRGLISPEQVEAAIRPKEPHTVQTALICLENTHNSGGGTIYPLATIERIRAVAVTHGIPMHLDGARLFNAVAATTLPPASYAQHFDTLSVCLSKGLGAPAGSLLMMNDLTLLDKAKRLRRMYGGAMRQSGILAAAGIYALEHNIGRLKVDHDHAKRLARQLQQIQMVKVNAQDVDTNIVIFEVIGHRLSPPAIVAALKQEGLLINAIGGNSFRAVTHLDISSAMTEEACEIFTRVLGD
jgi:threonine aldolase